MDEVLNVIEPVEEQLAPTATRTSSSTTVARAQRAGARAPGIRQPIRTQRDWYDANMGLCEPRAGEDPNEVSSDRPQLSDLDPPRMPSPSAP